MEKVNAFGGGLVKVVAAGIGFASESFSSYKDKKLTEYGSDNGSVGKVIGYISPQHKRVYFETDDNKTWALDDAQEKLAPVEIPTKTEKEMKERDTNKIISSFVRRHPPPKQLYSELPILHKLPLPVILPQKRPKDRSRGFVRAYAPVLEKTGIEQATFFDFLETFEQGIRASPWLEALNLVSLATFSLPIPEVIAIDMACFIAIETATSVQNRTRGNNLLSKFNAQFFQPRGLFCLLMTLNPGTETTGAEELAISSIVSRARISLYENKVKQTAHNLRRSDGTTSDVTIPQAAPLIFPSLDELAEQRDEKSKKKKDSLKAASEFVDRYLDKRAVAKYSAAHPESTLTQPKPVFRSRYADPTHPTASGNFRSLLTGGKPRATSPKDAKAGLIEGPPGDKEEFGKEKKLDDVLVQEMPSGDDDRKSGDIGERAGKEGSARSCSESQAGQGDKGVRFLTPMKKAIKSNVMYLLIVNMPSEAELAEAHAAIAEAGKGQAKAAWERCWSS
ncbi:hypothetical protein IFR05_005230 [Cadophora sp. M221]|nr:hypothetical protein IFR05_005230 [Cadophora sp. M221]